MSHLRRIATSAVLAACLVAPPAFAAGLQIENARAVMELHDGEIVIDVLLTITNTGTLPDRLYNAKSEVAKSAKLSLEGHDVNHVLATADGGHEHATVTSFEIQPGRTLRLDQDGRHLMLRDIRSPLKAGDSFALTLFFEDAGPVKITVLVRSKSP